MAAVKLNLTVDQDWLALNAYRMALDLIVSERTADQFGFSGEDAAAIAESVLSQFPMSEKAL